MHYAYDVMVLRNAGVHTRSDLFKANKGIVSPESARVLRKRAWYRRVDRVVDLINEDQEFEAYWSTFMKKAFSVHSSIYGSRYTDWARIRMIRRGKMYVSVNTQLTRAMDEDTMVSVISNSREYNDYPALTKALVLSDVVRQKLSGMVIQLFSKESYSFESPENADLQEYIESIRDQINNLW
jgi:uncharacterized protein (DUF2132 family)